MSGISGTFSVLHCASANLFIATALKGIPYFLLTIFLYNLQYIVYKIEMLSFFFLKSLIKYW